MAVETSPGLSRGSEEDKDFLKTTLQTVSAKSADYTVLDTDGIRTVLMTTGASDRTVTLPTVADNTNRIITVKKVDSGTGDIIVDGEGAETIDGVTTIDIPSENEFLSIQSDGTTWHVIAKDIRVGFRVNDSALTPTLTGSLQTLIFNGSIKDDTHAAYNSSTGEWTCPVKGVYNISTQFGVSGTTSLNNSSRITILKNDSISLQRTIFIYAAAISGNLRISALINNVPLVVGDIIEIQANSNITTPVTSNNEADNFFSISKISG